MGKVEDDLVRQERDSAPDKGDFSGRSRPNTREPTLTPNPNTDGNEEEF